MIISKTTFIYIRKDTNIDDKTPGAIVINACGKGVSEVKKILEEDYYPLNFFYKKKMCSPLSLAVENNDKDLCRYLLNHGAQVQNIEPIQFNPLLLASKNGFHEICEILIKEGGADVNYNTYVDNDYNPLNIAVSHRNVETAKILVKLGARCTESRYQKRFYPENILLDLCIEKNLPELLDFFLEIIIKKDSKLFDIHPDDVQILLDSFLKFPCNHKKEILQILLEKGADPNYEETDGLGYTPLFFYLSDDYTEERELLIKFGADVNFMSWINGRTPLFQACNRGCVKSCKFLIENGARLDKEIVENPNTSPFIALLSREFTSRITFSHYDDEENYEDGVDYLILDLLFESKIYITNDLIKDLESRNYSNRLLPWRDRVSWIKSEKKRREKEIYFLILSSRYFNENSLFSTENLPLDLLNEILLTSELISESQIFRKDPNEEELQRLLGETRVELKKLKTETIELEIKINQYPPPPP